MGLSLLQNICLYDIMMPLKFAAESINWMFIQLESKAIDALFDDDNLTSYRYIGKYIFKQLRHVFPVSALSLVEQSTHSMFIL